MAEQVDIVVQVTAKGKEALNDIDKELGNLSKKEGDFGEKTEKTEKSTEKLTTSLKKQHPALKQLQPLMSSFGISSLMTGAAVGGLAVALLKAGQTFQAFTQTMVNYGLTTSISGAGTTTFAQSMSELMGMSTELTIPLSAVIGNMTKLTSVTHSTTFAQQLFTDAVEAHKKTGMDVNTIVDTYIGILNGSIPIFDDATGKQLTGLDAIRAYNEGLDTQATKIGLLDQNTRDFANTTLENLKTTFGDFGRIALDVLDSIVVGWDRVFNKAQGLQTIVKYGVVDTFNAVANAVLLGNMEPAVNLLAPSHATNKESINARMQQYGQSGNPEQQYLASLFEKQKRGQLTAMQVNAIQLKYMGRPYDASQIPEGYAQGGTIPGPKGEPRLVIAHGGEEYLGVNHSGGSEKTFNLNLNGSTLFSFVYSALNDEVRLRGAW